jgi:hypothetical protein
MKKVERATLVDYQTYNDQRDKVRAQTMLQKQQRRVHVGEHLTFLFETTDTIRYHIQEMMRVEQIVREADIQHEIDTYNELLGDAGELGCTLLVEIDDPKQRDAKLSAWTALPRHLYLLTASGERVRPRHDERQVDTRRLSAVQYLKFRIGGARPLALGSDLPELQVEAKLTAEQQEILMLDATA